MGAGRGAAIRIAAFALTLAAGLAAHVSAAAERLVFGSFRNPDNAENWAARMQALFKLETSVLPAVDSNGRPTYRVVTADLTAEDADRLRRLADARGLTYWRLLDEPGEVERPAARAAEPAAADEHARPISDTGATTAATPSRRTQGPGRRPMVEPPVRPVEVLAAPSATEAAGHRRRSAVEMLDVDIGAQARTFFEEGLDGQDAFQPSISLQVDYYRAWDEERQSFTLTPFYRYDARDSERTHFDIREAFWSRVGDDWDLHVGVKQVFWGVTEFNHLVDVINQTDLVENIDGEDKLGQPMIHLSLIRNWGILDLHLLTGFRERTFPGVDGRPRFYLPIDSDDARYESGAGRNRVDGAVRWSHHLGPFEIGLYHFYGTSRAPLFEPRTDANGDVLLAPFYPVVHQTGLDAQLIRGDWAWKLEAIRRTNFPDRFAAVTAGFERTLVGVFNSRADLGLVVEYLYDDRGDDAFDTFFEHDIAIGTRWAFNDLGDTQALVGFIFDYETDESILSLEASRRLGEGWTLLIEGRAFLESGPLNPGKALDPVNKGASVAKDDYIELELTRYF